MKMLVNMPRLQIQNVEVVRRLAMIHAMKVEAPRIQEQENFVERLYAVRGKTCVL